MDVILLERVEGLGQMGDEVSVKPGYARNFLIPKKKALRATTENKRYFEAQKAQLEAVNLKQRSEAEAVAAKIDDTSVILVRQAGESGQLYGSVNARDIAAAVTAEGCTVTRQQVVLAAPIKTLGLHDVTLRLHPEVSITVTANVARSEDEAQTQAETGRAVVGGPDADEADADEALIAQADELFEDTAAEEIQAHADDDEGAGTEEADAQTTEDDPSSEEGKG